MKMGYDGESSVFVRVASVQQHGTRSSPRLKVRASNKHKPNAMSSSNLAVFSAASFTHPSPKAPSMPRRVSNTSKINGSQVHNRIMALMAHTTRYAFQGETRLARDAGVSKSAVSRLLTGQSSPSFALVVALTKALEKRLERPIDPRDLISLDGSYPTATACELAGCRGCLPAEAYDAQNRLKPEYKGVKPGQWAVSLRSPIAAKPREAR